MGTKITVSTLTILWPYNQWILLLQNNTYHHIRKQNKSSLPKCNTVQTKNQTFYDSGSLCKLDPTILMHVKHNQLSNISNHCKRGSEQMTSHVYDCSLSESPYISTGAGNRRYWPHQNYETCRNCVKILWFTHIFQLLKAVKISGGNSERNEILPREYCAEWPIPWERSNFWGFQQVHPVISSNSSLPRGTNNPWIGNSRGE